MVEKEKGFGAADDKKEAERRRRQRWRRGEEMRLVAAVWMLAMTRS